MTVEQFIQSHYFAVLQAAGVPIYDTIPTKKKLPAVVFGQVRCLEKKCCHAVVEIVMNVISAETSKATLYGMYDKIETTLESVTFEDEKFQLGFLKFRSSDIQTYRPDNSVNSGGEIWQLGILKYTNFVTKKCGEKQ